MRAVLRASAECALVALVPVLLLVIRYFSWGAGPLRLLTYALLFGFVALATTRRSYLSSVWEVGSRHWGLAWLAGGLLLLHCVQFGLDIQRGGICLTDMGRPSICAAEWLRRGMNPWSECAPQLTAAERRALPANDTYSECLKQDACIDRKAGGTYRGWTHHGPGLDFMDGYKYGPITALVYAPLTHVLRERGLFVVNFLFWLAHAGLLWALARVAYPVQRAAPWRSLIGWLLPLVLPMSWVLPNLQVTAFGGQFNLSPPERDTFVLELTRRCSNDIIPVVLGLAALYCAARRRAPMAGIFLGLSLGAKPLPGLLLCLLLPGLTEGRALRLLLWAALTATLCYLPFFAWAPREMIANLVLFSLLRPTNSSSIRAYLPADWEGAVSALQLLMCLVLVVSFYRAGPRDLARLLRSSALLCLSFVALNKVVHGNYLLWLQPLLALALGGLPFRPPTRVRARAATPVSPMPSALNTTRRTE